MPALSFRNKILLLLITCMCMTQVSTMLATLVSTEKTVRQSVDQDLLAAETSFDKLIEQRYQQLTHAADLISSDGNLLRSLDDSDTQVSKILEELRLRMNTALLVFQRKSDTVIHGLPAGKESYQQSIQALFNQPTAESNTRTTVTLDREHYQAVMFATEHGWLLLGLPVNDDLLGQFSSMTDLDISIFGLRTKYSSNIASTLEPGKEQQLIGELQNFGLLADNNRSAFDLTLHDEDYLTRIHLLQGGATPIFAILQKSLQQEMQPFRNLDKNLLTLFVQVMIVAVLGSIFVSNSVIAPVKNLAAIAERIGHGNYGIEIKVQTRDEIGQLGTTLNKMQHEIAERERKIVYQSQHDELTGLPNRYLLNDRIRTAIGRATRNQNTFTMVMMDIARFKQINDTLGHHIGDQVLKETAKRLTQRQRMSDTLARMGGDDFLLLLEDTCLDTGLALIRDNIQPLLQYPMVIDGTDISLRFHFGFAEFPGNGDCSETLVRRAEIALYEAKAQPGKLSVYKNGRDETHQRELAIASDLDAAMLNGQIMLHYQPKVNLATGDSSHAEALVRWQHPQFGWLPPDEFIPILEQTGNIEKLTAWVMNETARQCSVWLKHKMKIHVSINLSALDLQNPQLPARIGRCLTAHNISAEHLVLEITESAIMQDPQSARILLGLLRSAGFRIAIDDFGTGYSSLAQLKCLPLDELKIDKSFVQELTGCSQDAVIVKSTIDLAHSMNLQVIAEGIESLEALHLLQSFGCDQGQGYFFHKAMSASDFEHWHKTNRHVDLVGKDNAA